MIRGPRSGWGGIPPGGDTGQILAKSSEDDGDVEWSGIGITEAEEAAGVAPTNYYYGPGDVRRYGFASGGSASTNATALQAALNTGHKVTIPEGAYSVDTQSNISSNTELFAHRNAVITSTSAGTPILKGADVEDVLIDGGQWVGADTTTAIDGGDGGIIYIDNRGVNTNGNVTIRNIKVSTSATAGISCLNVNSLWIVDNEASNCADYGILASRSRNFHIEHNYIHDSAETGAANTYAIMATGDDAGGESSQRCSISFNHILNFASWDGIMSHDVTKLNIVGNTIENTRIGIDVGHIVSTNVVLDIVIANNNVHLTSTDNWGGAGAIHGGILLIGNASTNIQRAVVSGNIVRNAFNISGGTISGDAGAITIENCEYVAVSGNVVEGVGTVGTGVGIYMVGDIALATISGNVLDGAMGGSAIRLVSVNSSLVSITGNSISQDTASDAAINISSSTIAGFAMEGNATNSTAPFAQSGSTITLSDSWLRGSATYDPASLLDGDGATTAVTVTGASLGDFAEASFSLDLQGITLTAWVSSSNTVSVRFQNETTGTIDLGSGTLRAKVRRA